MTTVLTGAMLIGGSEVRGDEGEIRAVDPRTGQALEPAYGLGGTDEVDRAAELAWAAFAAYRDTEPERRAAFLDTIAANIEALGDDPRRPGATPRPDYHRPGSSPNAPARAVSCGCSPRSSAKAAGSASASTRPDPTGRRCPGRTSASGASRSARSRSSARATSRSRSRWPAATPPRRSRPARR